MTAETTDQDFTTQIGATLPYLRRYARALTGDQTSGDTYAAATLEAILSDRDILDGGMAVKPALFKVLHSIWQSSKSDAVGPRDGLEGAAQRHMAKLTDNTREALLLHTIEEFPFTDVAAIMAEIHKHAGKAHVIGLTGVPGSGKSTLVHAMAKALRAVGRTVGIVAVDPSSPYSGGAILGDRIRMGDLATDDGVFIRSLATRGAHWERLCLSGISCWKKNARPTAKILSERRDSARRFPTTTFRRTSIRTKRFTRRADRTSSFATKWHR